MAEQPEKSVDFEEKEAEEKEVEEIKAEGEVKIEAVTDFQEMGLDSRILKAITCQGWKTPTLIQQKAIPSALDGNNLVLKSRTGSGKTASYIVPIVQRLLENKKDPAYEKKISVLVLVPLLDLARQAHKMIEEICKYCNDQITSVNVASQTKGGETNESIKMKLKLKPDFIVGTPKRVFNFIQAGNIADLGNTLDFMVVDEADLQFSHGYKEEMEKLVRDLGESSRKRQTFLMSATLNEDVEMLRDWLVTDAVYIDIDQSQLALGDQLRQSMIYSETSEHKFLQLYVMTTYKLFKGKTIIFVNCVNNNVDKCYKLKLFLEQFGVRSTVLNSKLPLKNRCQIVEQFNQGLYNYMIATDEIDLPKQEDKKEKIKLKKNKKKKEKQQSRAYGVTRGIDFENVQNVINFDFPVTVESYIHRVGRTARGDESGNAISFILPEEKSLLQEVQNKLANQKRVSEEDAPVKVMKISQTALDNMKYRFNDIYPRMTRTKINDAMRKELRQEMLTNERLQDYFRENPNDRNVLRHDQPLQQRKIQRHLKNVPDYLMPDTMSSYYQNNKAPSHNTKSKKTSKNGLRGKRKAQDPLKQMFKKNRT